MNEDGAPFDSGFDDTGPFRVSPESGGVSLESALRDFGPAAIDDLIPRLRTLADRLDAAHRAGIVHGALHPSKIFVTDQATELVASPSTALRAGAVSPYAAPEVIDGRGATPLSDQYGLAAIAYEWLFGRPITHHGERPIEVRAMPGVDRSALSKAFTRALSPDPADRFATCGAFCDAMNGAIVPELPLLADFEAEEEAEQVAPPIADVDRDEAMLAVEPFDATPAEAPLSDADLKLDDIDAPLAEPEAAPVPAWTSAAIATPPARTMESPRFGPMALFLAVIVGAVFGFAAGYMARPRALQGGAPPTIATAPAGERIAAPSSNATDTPPAAKAGEARAPEARPVSEAKAPEKKAPETKAPATKAAKASENTGRLLVRSTPSGASVSVDGVDRGVTPLALRDLDMGTRTVVVTRTGYAPERRRVQISRSRPARTLDVRLAAERPRPATPATLGRPASATGTLAVESRPAGATVSINGTPRGTTPLTIDDLAPGDYRIVMAMPGYHNFTTTVRVVAGERVRAAYSLTALEQQ